LRMYIDYKKEREGKTVQVFDHGFISYKVEEDYLFIDELFVDKEVRLLGLGSIYTDEIVEKAKTLGLKKVYAQVDMGSLNFNDSVRAIMGYGMNLQGVEMNRFLTFVKEI
jgi:GNAT superfamily N-acetyltransferase